MGSLPSLFIDSDADENDDNKDSEDEDDAALEFPVLICLKLFFPEERDEDEDDRLMGIPFRVCLSLLFLVDGGDCDGF